MCMWEGLGFLSDLHRKLYPKTLERYVFIVLRLRLQPISLQVKGVSPFLTGLYTTQEENHSSEMVSFSHLPNKPHLSQG